ncbi:MAG: DMT family transporter [Clostridium sp.]|uniref:DMT family transporter n=2 Tax=Clostridium TaxID=1485 RepID=UPI002A74DD76|nr:DMT family transporter [Clostridium sp.]MCI6693846.1 DMT family transporter [Clostridium sp.]MDY2631442.1 DMT family transporter [Clostridium sp.]
MNKEKIFTNKINIIIIAIICTFLWGSAFPAVKVGYELFNILSNDVGRKLIFAGYRFFLAGVFVLILQLLMKQNIFKLSRKDLKEITILGVGQTTLQYIFFYLGMTYTTGVKGSIVNGTSTFFSIILAHLLYKNDKLNFNKILGCAIGFSGVVLVNLTGGTSALLGGFSFKGEGFIMIAAFMLSVSSLYSKKISQNKDAYTVTGYQLAIGGLILTIIGYILGGNLTNFNIKSTVLLIYMASLSAIAFALWSQLLKYNKVGVISVFNFLIPVFGTILSAIILKENIFDIKILVALLLVCTGIYLVYKSNRVKSIT